MMSFRTMIDRSRSGSQPMTAGFRRGNESFLARVDAAGITVRRAETEEADIVIEAKPTSLAAVVYDGMPIAEAEAAGMLKLQGDRKLAEQFVTLFPPPAKSGD